MPYRPQQYGSPRHYALKALREVAHQVESLVYDLDDRALRWRPAEGEWCASEIVGFLRDSEREDLRAVRAILARDGARIEERRAQHGPAEHDYRSARVHGLLEDFATLRERLVWALRDAEEGWQHRGQHPYRGAVTLEQWVHEIGDRDLEAMWKLRALHDRLLAGAMPSPR